MPIQSLCLQTKLELELEIYPRRLQHCSLPSVSLALCMQAPPVPCHLAAHGRCLLISVVIQVLVRLALLEQSIGPALHQRRGFPILFEDRCLK